MINSEAEIRAHLKSLTIEDIADSVFLVGIDLDRYPIEAIMDSIMHLLNDVITLKNIYENFKEEPKVLTPFPKVSHDPKDSPAYRRAITEDYFRKSNALSKIVSNRYIYDELVGRMVKPQEEDSMTL